MTAKPITIQTPVQVSCWRTSDGKEHRSEEDARVHETFLELNKILPKEANDRYSVICQVVRAFDLTQRTPYRPPSADEISRVWTTSHTAPKIGGKSRGL